MSGPWRVGEHYGIHVYEGDRPVATFHDKLDALRAVAAVNAELELRVDIDDLEDLEDEQDLVIRDDDEDLEDDVPALPLTLTTTEAAVELRVTRRTIYKLIADGQLPSIKVRGSRRITRQALLDYIGTTS